MQSVLRNDEGTHYHHGNLVDRETLKQAVVPAATSHPVVILWKLPVFLLELRAYIHMCHSFLAICLSRHSLMGIKNENVEQEKTWGGSWSVKICLT